MDGRDLLQDASVSLGFIREYNLKMVLPCRCGIVLVSVVIIRISNSYQEGNYILNCSFVEDKVWDLLIIINKHLLSPADCNRVKLINGCNQHR